MQANIQLKNNINKNYIYVLLQNMDLTRAVWMIYLASKGMSLTQIGLLETIFHITSFTMEVPTGAVADIFGRKVSRIWSRAASLISVILLLQSNSFLWFAISFVFSALSYNLESGAGDALIYDSLKEIGQEDEFIKVNGKKEVFFQMASIISFIAGGYLASKSYPTAFIITIFIIAITLLQAATFKEPSLGRRIKSHDKENVFMKQLSESIAVLKNEPKIGHYALFTQIILAVCTCIFYYFQTYLKADGYNEAMIGLIYGASCLFAALAASQTYRIKKLMDEQRILLLMPIIVVICIWGIVLTQYHYVFIILLCVVEGIIYVAMSDYINKMIPSEYRATILSFASMIFSFFMITLFPLIGVVGDKFTLKIAFMCVGMLGSIIVLINTLITLFKRNY